MLLNQFFNNIKCFLAQQIFFIFLELCQWKNSQKTKNVKKKRIIAINRDNNRIKKPTIFAHCLEIYLQKEIIINPAQNLMVENGIQTVLPDNLAGMLMPLPDIETLKLKCQKAVVGRQKLCFDFINTSFHNTFIFKKKDLMQILMLINTREKEIF